MRHNPQKRGKRAPCAFFFFALLLVISGGVFISVDYARAQTAQDRKSSLLSSSAPSPKVKIILDEYTNVTKETYTCADGSQQCLLFIENQTSMEDKVVFHYQYTPEDSNVFRTEIRRYSDDFTNTYRRAQCVITSQFNQTTRKGHSTNICNDQKAPIFDTDISYDPAFSLLSPSFSKGIGSASTKGSLSSLTKYITRKDVTEDGKAYLILDGGDPDVFYNIPLTVSAGTLISSLSDANVGQTIRMGYFVSRPILCSKIRVANQPVKGNCAVDVVVRGQSKTDITPSIENVAYYDYSFYLPTANFGQSRRGEMNFPYFEPEIVPANKVSKTARERPSSFSTNAAVRQLQILIQTLRSKVRSMQVQIDQAERIYNMRRIN
ncbi:MAG: hypothetical protein NUV53_04520 [Patescibacteria group bacterium]|nr:hypothetical protein [Patescibacteria group bacterium]